MKVRANRDQTVLAERTGWPEHAWHIDSQTASDHDLAEMRILPLLAGILTGVLLHLHLRTLFTDLGISTRRLIHHTRSSSKTALSSTDWLPRVKRKRPYRVFCWMILLAVDDYSLLTARTMWPQLCDGFRFVSQFDDPDNGVIGHHYNKTDDMDLWNQVHHGWSRVKEMFGDDYDYFVKLDADSFLLAPNLVLLAQTKGWNAESNIYFGHITFEQSRPRDIIKAQFNLGAGYGVSRGLLLTMYPYFPSAADSSIPLKDRCSTKVKWDEDVRFGDCVRVAIPDLPPANTLDAYERETFQAGTARLHFIDAVNSWYFYGKDRALVRKWYSIGCCSSRMVVWHKCRPPDQFAYYYLHLQFGVDPRPRSEPEAA